ncbi:MAG: hypothetical protein O2909_11780 [Chloroflexi bacterium]|nr:hypothetical protein [Chloroflexota bacterium]MDA1220102.1 hypothetical protein [Chloroflexota bacterium]
MPRLRLDLDRETFEALAAQALAERRPVLFQAEVLLRQTLGLPFPYPPATSGEGTTSPTPRNSHE